IDSGPRIRVLLPRSLDITFEGRDYERSDLRLGDRVYIVARRDGSHMDATALDVKNSTADALLDSLLRSHRTIVGRFGVREAKTEYFSLNLPGQNYVRVDAKDRKSTRLNSSHDQISYAVFCLKKKKTQCTPGPSRSRRRRW